MTLLKTVSLTGSDYASMGLKIRVDSDPDIAVASAAHQAWFNAAITTIGNSIVSTNYSFDGTNHNFVSVYYEETVAQPAPIYSKTGGSQSAGTSPPPSNGVTN